MGINETGMVIQSPLCLYTERRNRVADLTQVVVFMLDGLLVFAAVVTLKWSAPNKCQRAFPPFLFVT